MKKDSSLRLLIGVVAALSIFLFAYKTIPKLGSTTFDDAYMYIRYANNFLSGNGFAWNAVDGPAYGFTSTVFLLLITSTKTLSGFSNSDILTGWSFLGGLLSFIVLAGAGFLYGKHLRKVWLPLLIIPWLVICNSFRYHSITGMETTISLLANSLLVGAVFLYEKRQSGVRFALILAVAYFAYLTRPDNGFYCMLLPPLYLMAARTVTVKKVFVYVAAFSVILACDLLVKKSVFGSALPIPFYAKSAGYYVGYTGVANWNAAEYVFLFLRNSLPFVLGAILLFSRRTALVIGAILLPVLLTFIYYSGIVQIMGWFARYYFPSLPFIVMIFYVVVEDYLMHRKIHHIKPSFWRVAMLLMLTGVVIIPFFGRTAASFWRHYIDEPNEYVADTRYVKSASEALPFIGWWEGIQTMSETIERMPPDLVMAATEYGFIGSENPGITIIDMAGLQDKSLTDSGFSSEYILAQGPDLIWFPHGDYTYFVSELIDNTEFFLLYDFYTDIFNYGVAVKKNSDLSHRIMEELRTTFSRVYPGYILEDYLAVPATDIL